VALAFFLALDSSSSNGDWARKRPFAFVGAKSPPTLPYENVTQFACHTKDVIKRGRERESALPFEEPIEFVCALTAFSCQLALVEVRRHLFPLIKNNDKNCILKKKKTLLFFMLPFFL
jgi:hypothetical protein